MAKKLEETMAEIGGALGCKVDSDTLKKRLKNSVNIGNPKGGIGKSTNSHLFVSVADTVHGPGIWKLGEVDDLAQRRVRTGGSMAKRIDLTIDAGADLVEVEVNGRKSMTHYDPLTNLLLDHNTIIDQGANTQRNLLRWMERSGIFAMGDEEGVGFDILAVTDGTPESLDGAAWYLQNFARPLQDAEFTPRFFTILNDRDGSGFQGKHFDALMRLNDSLGGGVGRLPHIDSTLLRIGAERGLTLLDTHPQVKAQKMAFLVDPKTRVNDTDIQDRAHLFREATRLAELVDAAMDLYEAILPPIRVDA